MCCSGMPDDLERKLADFQAYYNAAGSHASLEGHTPLTFAGGHAVALAELNSVRWVSPLPGPGPASSGGLATNSRGQGEGQPRQAGHCHPPADFLGFQVTLELRPQRFERI